MVGFSEFTEFNNDLGEPKRVFSFFIMPLLNPIGQTALIAVRNCPQSRL